MDKKITINGNRMSTRNSPSRTIKGERDYRFHTPRQAKIVAKNTMRGATAKVNPTFIKNINDGYNKGGCNFLNTKYRVLNTKLSRIQMQGTNPAWQQRLGNKLNWLYNFGQTNGCWSSGNGGGYSPSPKMDSTGNVINGSFACQKSGASYGFQKIDGRIRGEIKTPLSSMARMGGQIPLRGDEINRSRMGGQIPLKGDELHRRN